MKRWPIELDGSQSGHVYADTLDGARRAAQAVYRRVHPDRDPVAARVRVGEGGEVESAAAEARLLVGQVYEGLRLLPGMEMPAEKLRSAVVLLDSVAARHGLAPQASAGAQGGGGGDNELREALSPVLQSRVVPELVRERLQGLVEWVGVNTPEPDRRRVERDAFRALWDAGLVDPHLAEAPACALHRASAHLQARLVEAGTLRLERFQGATRVDQLRAALEPYPKDAVRLLWTFTPGEGDQVEVLRPLALTGERVLQPALLVRGVTGEGEEVVAFERALFDALVRLQAWADGLGQLADALLEEKQRQLLSRTEKRIEDTRERMLSAARAREPVLPSEATRRDLMKFVIDQVHRIQDALTFLPDHGLRDAWGELVFKDVAFRGAGAYLSKYHGIGVDTEVVAGADSQGMGGRYKTEAGGPRPRERSTRIHSVVVPCYVQDGVVIRPAAVRIGEY